MFWGAVLKAGSAHSEVLDRDELFVNHAALESAGTEAQKAIPTSVYVVIEGRPSRHLLFALGGTNINRRLDLGFSCGEKVTFSVEGPGTVHLTGKKDDICSSDSEDEGDESQASEDSDEGSDPGDSPAQGSSKSPKSLRKRT